LLMGALTLWGWVSMENKILKALDKLVPSKGFVVGNDLVFAEIVYCDQFDDSLLRYASTWAAKEAVYKAIKQIDDSTLGWKKIEITRNKPAGKPGVIIYKDTCSFKISLTISHDGDYAWAIALIDTKL
jgi:holo-[acyl-carrier protein] synthase